MLGSFVMRLFLYCQELENSWPSTSKENSFELHWLGPMGHIWSPEGDNKLYFSTYQEPHSFSTPHCSCNGPCLPIIYNWFLDSPRIDTTCSTMLSVALLPQMLCSTLLSVVLLLQTLSKLKQHFSEALHGATCAAHVLACCPVLPMAAYQREARSCRCKAAKHIAFSS